MGDFLHKYNTDNVHARAVIVGLINLLNSRVQYEQVLSDTNVEIVTVPFIYNMGGDERFLQDYFLHWNDCVHPRMANGNYDVWPRGSITLTNNSINTTAMTHRFVRATYVKEVNGELQRYNAFLNSLPLVMNFDIEIRTNTELDAFKIQQSVMETFYKTQIFSVNFRGFRVPCQAGFSDDISIEKTFEFTYGDNNKIGLKFTIAIETYYPVTDPTTERKDSNRMTRFGAFPSEFPTEERNRLREHTLNPDSLNPDSLNPGSQGIGLNIYPIHEKNKPPYYIDLTSPGPDATYFSTGTLPIAWLNTGTVMSVNIYYQIVGTSEWVPIIIHSSNTGFYDWVMPFFTSEGKETDTDNLNATLLPLGATGVTGPPPPSVIPARVRAIVDSLGSVNQVVVFDPGVGYDNTYMIDVSIIPRPFDPTPTFTPPVIQASVNNSGGVEHGEIFDGGSGFTESSVTQIRLKVEDTSNPAVFDILHKNGRFTGNTNIISDEGYITNMSPTANDLVDQGYLFAGLTVTGNGVMSGSIIVTVDIVNNRVKLNQPLTDIVVKGLYSLSSVDAILTIK